MPSDRQPSKVDFRVYLGVIVFRWHVIAVCFLYCLLAAVLYVNLAPKKYATTCEIQVFRDPLLEVSGQGSQWVNLRTHIDLLTDTRISERVVERLVDLWGSVIGDRKKMLLEVSAVPVGGTWQTLRLRVLSNDPQYGRAYMRELLDVHKEEWDAKRGKSTTEAAKLLSQELENMEEKIRMAEDEVIEFQRLHDLARASARGQAEQTYLTSLVGRRTALSTQLMMLEAMYPVLKNENVAVISEVSQLLREQRTQKSAGQQQNAVSESSGTGQNDDALAAATAPGLPAAEKTAPTAVETGWQDLRARLAQLQSQETEMAANLTAEHPRLRAVREEIQKVQADLSLAAEVELRWIRDQHKALTIQLNAIEAAEYKWQAKHLMLLQRQAELNRLQTRVSRYERNYATLYERYHDTRVQEELKAERFTVVKDPKTEDTPVWPDAQKILLAALGVGVGLGFGLAFLLQLMDNKIQSISDVEQELKIRFLGGIPFWVRSGLEKAIRPIVTEEHSTGAIEAYRALRTSVLAALERENEKVVFVTSADSREGKTLTALNLAIMIAQMNKRVLLVDMDLRRGRLHRSLGVERAPGVTDVLKENRPLKEVILRTPFENLDFAPTGGTADDAAELLQSHSMEEFFRDVREDYDYIITDTSPVLRVTDTVIVATQGVGMVIYVARVNHTPKPLIKYSLDMLQEARVIGLIMNSIEMHKISSLYYAYQYPNYAYYSNAYTYGYDYYYYGEEHQRKTPGEKRGEDLSRRTRSFGRWIQRTFLSGGG